MEIFSPVDANFAPAPTHATHANQMTPASTDPTQGANKAILATSWANWTDSINLALCSAAYANVSLSTY